MPQMANVTVKSANGTTDVVFVAKVPSAGDKSAARWEVDAASTYRNQRPNVSVSSQFNGERTARRVNWTANFPVVRTENSVAVVKHVVPVSMVFTIPTGLTDSEANEVTAQMGNFLASALAKQVNSEGYSPT